MGIVIKYINTTANFCMKNENYGTASHNFGQPKSQLGRNTCRNGLQRTGDQPQHQEHKEDDKEKDPSAWTVWPPYSEFKIIN